MPSTNDLWYRVLNWMFSFGLSTKVVADNFTDLPWIPFPSLFKQ